MTSNELLRLLDASPLPDEMKAQWREKLPSMSDAEKTNLSYILTADSVERLDQLDAWVDRQQEKIVAELNEIGTTGVRKVYAVAEEADKKSENPDAALTAALAEM